jgi:hypothetical protein
MLHGKRTGYNALVSQALPRTEPDLFRLYHPQISTTNFFVLQEIAELVWT